MIGTMKYVTVVGATTGSWMYIYKILLLYLVQRLSM